MQATQVKANSLPPVVLSRVWVALAALQQHCDSTLKGEVLTSEGAERRGLPEKELRELLDLLAVWTANKMKNLRQVE